MRLEFVKEKSALLGGSTKCASNKAFFIANRLCYVHNEFMMKKGEEGK